ncbi:MAG TPA: alpha-ketoacid dehydrogenase subunit beta [Nitrospira sp.]|jgi:2-oxoisovalerate dehydrogenase E1 component beta subunit|nr:alpha-ketoacid dehydrogenase subunit beta [Nitrospira sp.]
MTTATTTHEVTYVDAISQALDEEMTRDERVFLMGEDIGTYGGAFKVTEGLLQKYGEWRVLDTPLSESGFVGAAIGAAMMGLRPVVEMQFADFISCAFDQITEVAAKNHYRWGAAVPLVIRAPFGGGVHGGPFHSECPEGWFFHSPGLKIVAPSTPYDAKGLLKAAIRDPNPVLYFEHKFLYRRIKAVLPQEDFVVPLGKADVKRRGRDLSVITYGAMVHLALEAAELLNKEGIDLEVVDLRTLIPLDKETLYESVRKTSKVILLHEDNKTGGIGAEIAALLAEECFDCLDGPILRIAPPDTPVPFSTPLEEFFLPKVSDIVSGARRLAAY